MKRSLVLVPILLLVLLNACGPTQGEVQEMVNQAMTGVAATQTATFMPTPTGTPDPNEYFMKTSLNAVFPDSGGPGGSSLQAKLNDLEDTIGADFQIRDLRFPIASNGLSMVFEVHVGCECATNGSCCTKEHLFVLTMGEFYLVVQQQPYNGVLDQVPSTVEEMKVVCYDHQKRLGSISVAWTDAKSFFYNSMDGDMLGMRITPGP